MEAAQQAQSGGMRELVLAALYARPDKPATGRALGPAVGADCTCRANRVAFSCSGQSSTTYRCASISAQTMAASCCRCGSLAARVSARPMAPLSRWSTFTPPAVHRSN